MVPVGVDLAGSDVDQRLLYSTCREVVGEVGRASLRVYSSLKDLAPSPRITCVYCPDVVSMEDRALSAIRRKKNSSLVRGLMDVRRGEVAALVTCGNTGAVTAASVVVLKKFHQLHHPALVVEIPLSSGPVVALDVGAFVTATARDLVCYACLGLAYTQVVLGIASPRVGLLNIGREAGRGTPELRQAGSILSAVQSDGWRYVGNVEPQDVFSGCVDVLVTGGFAGNIFLKTAEALVPAHPSGRGALVLGVQGTVIKCHGASSLDAFEGAIRRALSSEAGGILSQLEQSFGRLSREVCHP